MSDWAIRIEGLSKQYRLGTRERYRTLRDTLTDTISAPWRALSKGNPSSQKSQAADDHIWALKDISLEIPDGQVVGVIGQNGAGKSTLLKILSRITEPTEGAVDIRGRAGSLLEVGTGFHPELTGRENIYLNGAILGMKKVEIDRKFDEIVAFAEIARFLDTPVKHYSSGMYVRLAFAVAAYMEPDILLVDEVLAVGDAAFQKKCLGKIGDVAKQGRTVLFVSHNMPSITMLCERAILLSAGRIAEDGPATQIVNAYLSGLAGETGQEWKNIENAPGSDWCKLRSVRVIDPAEQACSSFHLDQDFYVELTYWLLKPGLKTNVGYHLHNVQGVLVFVSNDFHDRAWVDVAKETGVYRSVCKIPGSFLNEGGYILDVALTEADFTREAFFLHQVARFDIVDDGRSEVRGKFAGPWTIGVLRPKLEWKTTKID